MVTEKEIENLITMTKLKHSETDFRRIPMDEEYALMSNIREGKYQEIHLSNFDKLSPNLGDMARHPFTQYSYFIVSAIALFTRAAIAGGASPEPPIVLLCKKRTDEVLHSPHCTYSSLSVSPFLFFALSSLILPIRFLIWLPCFFPDNRSKVRCHQEHHGFHARQGRSARLPLLP